MSGHEALVSRCRQTASRMRTRLSAFSRCVQKTTGAASEPPRIGRTGRTGWLRTQRGALVLAAGLLCAACTPFQLSSGTPSTFDSNQPLDAQNPDAPLVGLAISGGGNRAALFTSYVIELLGSVPVVVATDKDPAAAAPVSLLNTVSYVSSVSGGSFAAAYFGIRGLGNYDPMLKDDPLPKKYTDFFNNFHATMNANWTASLLGLDGLPFGSAATRLKHSVDARIANGATFRDLDQREASRTSPYLIFNTTHYDSGRRFVMTTIPTTQFCLNVEQLLVDIVHTPSANQPDIDAQRRAKLGECDRTDALTPEGFDSFFNPRMTAVASADFPIAQAVATSGAFPIAVGPIAYRVDNSRDLLHLIDGGVADNSGVESLVQLFLRKLIENPKRRGMIIELNAGLPFNARGTAIADDSQPLTAIIDDPTRLSDIQEVRASLYRQDLWLLTENVAKTMKHSTNAVTRLDIKELQHTDLRANALHIDTATCHAHFDDARSVREAVRNIPTSYHLDPCSADLVRIAACWSVHQHAAELQSFFSGTDDAGNANASPAPDLSVLDKRIRSTCPELAASGAL